MRFRHTILCLALALSCLAQSPQAAHEGSPALMEAYNRAKTYYEQGHYAEAVRYADEALRLGEEEFGPDDPTIAFLINDLALFHYYQGNYAEAEPLHKRALAIREEALGPEDPAVAVSLDNLGLVYRAQGRYAEAESLHKRALAIFEKAFGSEHSEHSRVAASLNNLALVYRAQRRYAEAEPLYKRSLTILEKTLGPEHLNVAWGLENYAVLLRVTGRSREADRMEARAKAIRAKYD